MSTYDELVSRGRKVVDHHRKTMESIEWQFYRTIAHLQRLAVKRARNFSNLLSRR